MIPKMVACAALLVFGVIPCLSAYAESPAVELGVTAWNVQASGQGTSTQGGSNSNINLQSDLGLQRQWTGGAYFIWRHDLPIVPNFLLGYDHVFNDGDTFLNRTITWQGNTYQANGRVQSQIDLKMERIEVFWNPLDNALFTLRLGLDLRHLDLNIPVTGTVNSPSGPRKESASAGGNIWLPLGNVGLTFRLPGHVNLSGEASYIGYSGSHLSDYRAQLSYVFDSGIRIFAGWRYFRLHLESSRFSLTGDLDFKGIYTGIGYAF